ncbi:MAG: DUF424 family protein [Candidatus Aenigmarchaeota archaeon]|nr:DUF424 family protein [Candidatus Aenigmarchaeota archaeon]
MQKFYIKIVEADGETLLAGCDEDVAGKIFEDEKARLTVSEQFYCGKICDENELVAGMRTATIINLAGNECVEIAVKNGFVKKHSVLNIGGISHAQAVIEKYSSIE